MNKLQKAIEQYEMLSLQIKELEEKKSKRKKYISSYVMTNGKVEHNGVSCFPVSRTKIQYDIPRIVSKFKRKDYIKFVDDTTCFDTAFFVKKCKELGVNQSEFIQPDVCTKTLEVNEKKLQKLTDSGEITFEQLKGCYTTEVSTSVTIRLG